MRPRQLGVFGLVIVMAVALSGMPALAAKPAASTGPLMQSVQWVLGPASPFAGTRFDGEFVQQQGRVYYLGFRTLGDLTDGSVWYYDTATQTYTDTGVDMPTPVSNYQVAALRNASGQLGLYIFGGRNANAQISRAVQVYNPATNSVAQLGSDLWPGRTPAGCVSLPAMGVAVVSNRAYVMGGMSFAANGCVDDQSAETWVFDATAAPGARWTAGPPLNVARGYITPAVLRGRIYAIGGDTIEAGLLIPTQTVESFMPPGGSWDDVGVADLPVACDESQAFGFRTGPLRNGVVLAGCGQWPNAVTDTYFYDAATNAWSLAGAVNEVRRNHAGALIPQGTRQVMFILGGYGAPNFFDPVTSSERGIGGPATAPAGAGSSSGAGASTN